MYTQCKSAALIHGRGRCSEIMAFTWALAASSGRILASEWPEPLAGLSSSKNASRNRHSGEIVVCWGIECLRQHFLVGTSKNLKSRFLFKSSVKGRLWLRSSIVVLDTEGQSGAICCSVNTEPEKALECLCSGSWSARSAGGQGRWYTSEWRLTSQH